ncbi:MAG: hypothetical protein AVDCRST_MAG79-1897 [uncultured Thermoleophilia bacterium]|uniref:Major facilitator superfamily (MFS) profile domain-containing protein n=1 Tax=uncultured Thermoleophilia bacterium TaxID=1497501 RepID=A0A6J4U8C7_9ACTN|nr:MAG: hypothetical protein AVDCRST_MAG79-1897 [uncultured Thermoleophilia bacterium]
MSRRNAILLAAVLSQTAISLIQFGLPALTFALRDERGVGPAEFGVLFAAVGLGSAVSLIVAGRACDRLGARPVLVVGTVVGAAGLAAAGISTSSAGLAGALFVAGVGGAAVPVAGMTAVLAHFPPERRGTVLGLRQTAVPAGGAVAALLLPALARADSLRLALLVPAALVLATGLLFAVVVGPGRAPAERRAPTPPGLPPGLRRVMVVGTLYVVALSGVIAFAAPAAEAEGLTARQAELLLAVLNVGAVAARLGWGRVSDRDGGGRRVRTLVDVGVLGTASALLFPLALHGGLVTALPAALLLAFGTLGFNGLVYLLAGELGGRDGAGTAVGAAATAVFLAGSVAGPVLGVIVETAGFGTMFVAVAACTMAGALLARGVAPAPSGRGDPGVPSAAAA